MNKTKIDWADMTWNPVTGCLHGCEYCYAQRIAHRFAPSCRVPMADMDCGAYDLPGDLDCMLELNKPAVHASGKRYTYPWGFAPTFHRYRLDEPAKIKEPKSIFVCSMADLFGEWVPDEWIQAVFEACEAAPQHRYLFLTKNPKRYFSISRRIPDNWWFGNTITGGETRFPASDTVNCFLSIEPLLEPIGLMYLPGIRWVIIGAETGNRKGKIVPKFDWVMDIKRACVSAGVPVFMKESLRCLMGDEFVQDFPWEEGGDAWNLFYSACQWYRRFLQRERRRQEG